MANYCYNYANFSGTPEQIKKLIISLEKQKSIYLKKEYIDKQLVIPPYATIDRISLSAENYNLILSKTPDDYTKADYDVYELYGSKWFECEWQLESETNCSLLGDSAWSPVLFFFAKICKKFKLICYGDYAESGNDFAGEFTISKKGEISIKEMTYRKYESVNNPDNFWEDVLSLILDGYFEDFQEVLDYFQDVDWILNEDDVTILQNYYKDYLLNCKQK